MLLFEHASDRHIAEKDTGPFVTYPAVASDESEVGEYDDKETLLYHGPCCRWGNKQRHQGFDDWNRPKRIGSWGLKNLLKVLDVGYHPIRSSVVSALCGEKENAEDSGDHRFAEGGISCDE
jgi:hypothetical protein